MVDNYAFTPGSGATGAADDVGGVLFPRVKLSLGPDGAAADALGGAGAVAAGVQRVTLASDDPGIALLTTIDADTGGMLTSLQTLDNAISGSEMQVDVVTSALPTGAATEAKQDTSITHLAAIEAAVESMDTAVPDQGQAAESGSVPVIEAKLTYEHVAASQTDQVLGATGAAGDYLHHLVIIPATTSPGAVSIEDGATNMTIFTGGTDSVTTLHPFHVHLRATSVNGGWEVTTGTNVSVFAVGVFT